jgi:hypothetical protein
MGERSELIMEVKEEKNGGNQRHAANRILSVVQALNSVIHKGPKKQ